MDLNSVVFVLVINVCGLLHQSNSFNIDVKSAKVFTSEPGNGFGYSAEFLHQENGKMSLLVGAPKENITEHNNVGIYYTCDPLSNGDQCTPQNTPPQSDVMRDYKFGEDKELFGLALTLADERTALACAPMWSDIRWWHQKYDFNVGRCLVLPAADGAKGVAPYYESDNYISVIELEGKETRQMNYGRAEFGVSADGDGKGRVVIGATGYSVSRGGVVVLDTRFMNFTVMKTILDPEPDIFLGYAVAAGNFCGANRFCFAASNRQVQGKVHLLEHVQDSVFKSLLWLKGEQEYSSFGSALCAADVTGDGWADLLVGSPTHSLYSNDSQTHDHYDQGRVFVYISQGQVLSGQDNLLQRTTLSGDEVSFSRFGSAISSIGDINRDSINDIAVGAPLEEEGAGAVYIYLGSVEGPVNRWSQKIRGRAISPALSSFGAHISKPTSRLSDYNYPDFAVGAPTSSAVVFLKTRLIVNAQVSIETTPNPVDKVNALCPGQLALSESGCANVTLCLNFTYSTTGLTRSSESRLRSLDFDLTLEVDQLISSDQSRRVRLHDRKDGSPSSSSPTNTTLHLPLTVTSTSPLCLQYLAILRQDQIHRNPFLPVMLHAKFRLNTTSFSGIAPMLNQSMPQSVTHQLRLKNQCGQDELCQTDLVLTGRVQYVPRSDDKYPFNVINDTKQVELVLDVLNRRETSFGMSLTVGLSGHMEFLAATGNTTILCDDNDVDDDDNNNNNNNNNNDNHNQQGSASPVLKCRGFSPLAEGETVQIRLKFLADTVPLEPGSLLVTFEVKVMPFDPRENPEMNEKDNALTLESQTAIVADVRLDGSSTPSMTYVADSDRNDVAMTHKVLVTNRGPSFLPDTVLNVTVPVIDSTARDIVLSANVTIKQQGRLVVECRQLGNTGASVGGIHTTSTTSTTSTTTSITSKTSTLSGGGGGGGGGGGVSGDGDGGAGSTTSDPFGGGPDIAPSKRRRRRRRREAEAEEEEGAEGGQSHAAPAGDRSLRMDCSNYQCRTYQCPLTTLQAKERAEVNVTVILRRASIAYPGNVDSLFFVTTTSVAEPDLVLFHHWPEPKRREVVTQLKRVSGGDEINIWYIIGGVLGGLLLLLLIGVLAWKCGFFKRKDKAKLEKLKRQSGFYESNRSVKRNSQRASTSGSASGPDKE